MNQRTSRKVRNPASTTAPRRGELAVISAGRGIFSTLFLLAGFGAVALAPTFRNVEATIAPHTFDTLGMGPARHLGGPYFLTMGTGVPIKFSITTQCGAMLLLVPMLFAAALMVRSPNVSLRRSLAAVIACAVVLVFANQLRLAIIGVCSRWFGFDQGFPLGHLLIGSLFSLVAIAASVLGFLRIVRTAPDAIVREHA